MMLNMDKTIRISFILCSIFALVGCDLLRGGTGGSPHSRGENNADIGADANDDFGTLFGDGLTFKPTLAAEDKVETIDAQTDKAVEQSVNVNPILWRAALDTFTFLPLASADAKSGIIIYDWFSDPNAPNERLKINAHILSYALRGDAIRVFVHKQVKQGGAWVNAALAPMTNRRLEDAILMRARELQVAQTE